MSWLDGVARRLGYMKVGLEQEPAKQTPIGTLAVGQQYSMPSDWSVEQQQNLYRTLSWVYVAVSHVAELAASQELEVMQVQGEEKVEVPNHPFELLLLHPNELQSRFEFLVATFSYYALTGNAYWWLNRLDENRPPGELWVLPSNMVTPIPDGKMYIKGYNYKPTGMGGGMVIAPSEIVHFKRFNPASPFVGSSPIETLATIAAGDVAMQRWNTNYFGRENAKVPGALAFADSIRENDWTTLKADIKEQWGGVNRSGPLLLRNAGQGGVQWLQMSLSQQDMQFLEGRKFNKEEIFSAFAPGLASVLDVSATEANAKSGRATLMEYAVWPLLVSMGEKITNDLLPAYGDGLQAEFDDPRVTDVTLELNQIAAYERTHTIDEVRSEWYSEEPLPDERGGLFVAEMSKAAPSPFAMPAATSTAKGVLSGPQMGELGRWQRKALKAISTNQRADAHRFVSDILPGELQVMVHEALKTATNPAQVDAVFDNVRLKDWPVIDHKAERIAVLTRALEDAAKAVREAA